MKRNVLWSAVLLLVGMQIGLRFRDQEVVAETGRGGAAPCGDINGDGAVDISDAVALLNFLFSGGSAPVCPPPECINLRPLPIDCDDIALDCNAGSCTNTLTFSVESTAAAPVGPVTIQVTIDPAFVTNLVVTLNPGINTFSVSTPPGPLCYDPNCTVSVTVDTTAAVAESNELDNDLTVECIG